jgi:predicted nucleic acid-binding protein
VTVLVDSDILIEIARGRNETLAAKWIDLALRKTLILYSPITLAELWSGARPNEHAALQAMFDALVCLPVTAETGRRAGAYMNRFRKSHNVEVADAIIAATAVQAGALLWTRNRKHYPMKEIQFYPPQP